ncbi:MAG TPA: NAD-dependent epimerase/dehydratase family protein [Acidimicrobiales bacterium]|nr:NAD-dependent epimerase/dehydratase family protein [Acidimicrobiales bacterium]
MRSVVVTGSAGPVGRRLVAALGPAAVTLDLAAASDQDLDAALARAEVVAHLDWTLAGPRVAEQAARANVESTRRLLAAAGRRSVDVLVLLSSATVYGAWRDNPIPLTEEAPLRPNPGVVDAVHHAEAERLVTEWADDHPAARVVILRPAMVLGPGVDTWLTRALGGRPAVRPDQADPPRQFVHVDDVAGAVLAAIEGPLAGTFNVAADGWLTGEAVRGLSAGRPTVPIPGRLASDTARWAWDLHLFSLPLTPAETAPFGPPTIATSVDAIVHALVAATQAGTLPPARLSQAAADVVAAKGVKLC